MKVSHEMPFGTCCSADGVSFRLWAPSVSTVRLELPDSGQSLPMQPKSDGWFEYHADPVEVHSGTRYGFRLPDGLTVPDPASRSNPDGVHGFSRVVDPHAYEWSDKTWRGRPWHEAVIYELHVGTYSREGFDGVRRRLDYLAELGVTALELMPLASFPGKRGWGYDGVLLYAPQASYGDAADLKALIEAAHERGLMVLLDVVYNHFGPEGNYLHVYAPEFFTERHTTPWGAAMNFDGKHSATVREFFIHNALYWLEEYRVDGLRLDAVHAILDDSRPDVLEEIASRVRAGPGQSRHIHLVLENDQNAAHRLKRDAAGKSVFYDAQWNDDFHHAAHVILTGERTSYYADYPDAVGALAGALCEGFVYQGQHSAHRGAARGEASTDLPATAFVNFLQNHDQTGNRAKGERLSQLASEDALGALTAVLLLAPSPPLLFMGEEYAADSPFLYFCDFGPELAAAVREGRRREFADFHADHPEIAVPDPGSEDTFERSTLDLSEISAPPHAGVFELHRRLLALRAAEIMPLIPMLVAGKASYERLGNCAFSVFWPLGSGGGLRLLANLCGDSGPLVMRPVARTLYINAPLIRGSLPPWFVHWSIEGGA